MWWRDASSFHFSYYLHTVMVKGKWFIIWSKPLKKRSSVLVLSQMLVTSNFMAQVLDGFWMSIDFRIATFFFFLIIVTFITWLVMTHLGILGCSYHLPWINGQRNMQMLQDSSNLGKWANLANSARFRAFKEQCKANWFCAQLQIAMFLLLK